MLADGGGVTLLHICSNYNSFLHAIYMTVHLQLLIFNQLLLYSEHFLVEIKYNSIIFLVLALRSFVPVFHRIIVNL